MLFLFTCHLDVYIHKLWEMAESYPTVLSRVTATKDCVLQWITDGEKIRSPQEVFQEEVHVLEDSIQKDRDLMSCSRDPDQLSGAFDRAVRCSGKLKELQINYESTASQKEESYHQSLEAHLRSLAKDIVDTLGTSLVEQALRLAQADFKSSSHPDADGTAPSPLPALRSGRKRRRPESPKPEKPSQRRLRRDLNRTEGEPAISIAGRRKHKDVDAITCPVAGEIYQGYRHNSKSWSAVLLLTLGDFADIGLAGTLKDTGLLNGEIPPCYKYKKGTKHIRWQVGFEDNGPSIIGRHFPVLFFDDQFLKSPKQSEFGWVAAKDLKEFDPEDPSVCFLSNYKPALDFYKHRHPERNPEMQQEEEMITTDNGSQTGQQLRDASKSTGAVSPTIAPSDSCLSSVAVSGPESDDEEMREAVELLGYDNELEDISRDVDVDETIQPPKSDTLRDRQGVDPKLHQDSTNTRASTPVELSQNLASERIASVPQPTYSRQ
ncbi:hypothetical protein F5Y08DRAFT_33063 [Xylaria arbuscula]|nr:hypothetical protein F5Y08DRAFT_33063 [Xylaria arbuscula]